MQKCPFDAIMIINLPKNLEKETTHRYSANSFKLHRLPVPRPGQVTMHVTHATAACTVFSLHFLAAASGSAMQHACFAYSATSPATGMHQRYLVHVSAGSHSDHQRPLLC